MDLPTIFVALLLIFAYGALIMYLRQGRGEHLPFEKEEKSPFQTFINKEDG